MVNIGISGANGKMGKEIISAVYANEFTKLGALLDKGEMSFSAHEPVFSSLNDDFFKASDVVIDFSAPLGTKALLEYLLKNTSIVKPLVIGTTGLTQVEHDMMRNLSEHTAILYATNMSLGVALLNRLAGIASAVLRDFDIEIVEMHHRHKKDSPSGTALTLASSVAKARDLDLKDVMICGRQGIVGARSRDEISVLSMRGGDVAGRHTVGFYNDGEYIELNHTATSRATFAKGALKAAIWLANKPAGLYSIDDCLGL